jgi:glutathione S-transferase
MKITLYYAPISCSLVPYIALSEAGAEFDVRVINMMKGDHMAADFLSLNPRHKVPLLVVDDQALTENVAILQWIARQFPAARLLPGGMDEFRAISLMAWCASGIHPFLTPHVMPQRYCDLPDSAENVQQCAQKMLHENFGIADAMLAGRDWFFDGFTIPDAYFFWTFRRAKQFKIDISAYANCNAHFDRVAARDSVQGLLRFEKEALA